MLAPRKKGRGDGQARPFILFLKSTGKDLRYDAYSRSTRHDQGCVLVREIRVGQMRRILKF
jgi:hypothetical protein